MLVSVIPMLRDACTQYTLNPLELCARVHACVHVGDRTAKSKLPRAQISESQFADDLALYAVDRGVFKSPERKFVEVGSQFGLTVSIPKTKGLAMGAVCESDGSPVDVGAGMVELVKNFTYLSSKICQVTVRQLLKCTLARASKAFGALRVSIFNCYLSINTKRSVYTAVVISILLYGAETWTLKAPAVRTGCMLTSFHHRCVRTILLVTRYS